MRDTKKEILAFFIIAFAWMWLLNAPRVLASLEVIQISALLSTILGYSAVFGPGIAAFILTRIKSGKLGARSLWKKGWTVRFPKKWFIPALVLMPVMGSITVLILRLFEQPVPWEYGLSPAMIVPIGLLIWLLGALPEEYGWRGYALPRLLERFTPLAASLILGLIWGLWHDDKKTEGGTREGTSEVDRTSEVSN